MSTEAEVAAALDRMVGSIEVLKSALVGGAELDPSTVRSLIVKASDESRFTLGVSYPVMKAEKTRAKDGHRDFAGADVVEKAAWSYLANGPQVGIQHVDGTEGAGTVVESYVYRGPDWPINGRIIKAGTWLLGTIWEPDAWSLIKSRKITGLSPQGRGARRVPTPERLAQVEM